MGGLLIIALTVGLAFELNYSFLGTNSESSTTNASASRACPQSMQASASQIQTGLNISVGKIPLIHPEVMNTLVGTQVTFIGSEEWPVHVSSSVSSNVSLSVSNVPCGIWAKIIPAQIPNVGPSGVTARLLLAGAMSGLPGASKQGNASLVIEAAAPNGLRASYTLPIQQHGNLTELESPGPVIQAEAGAYSSAYTIGNTSDIFGIVYNPSGAQGSQTLNVSLSASGLVQDGSLVPFPSWMKVSLPTPTFILNSSEPYYFEVNVSTLPPHFGSYEIAIGESANGQLFSDIVTITTHNPPPVG